MLVSASSAAVATTATVPVTVTILPYAEVTLQQSRVDVKVTPSEQLQEISVTVAGTVTCNYPVTLVATINKPEQANGTWSARFASQTFNSGRDQPLGNLTIEVSATSDDKEFPITLLTSPSNEPGTIVVTVVPQQQ